MDVFKFQDMYGKEKMCPNSQHYALYGQIQQTTN